MRGDQLATIPMQYPNPCGKTLFFGPFRELAAYRLFSFPRSWTHPYSITPEMQLKESPKYATVTISAENCSLLSKDSTISSLSRLLRMVSFYGFKIALQDLITSKQATIRSLFLFI
jgi:hypothetical protein